MVCQGFKGGKEFTDLPLEGGFEPSPSSDDSIIFGGGERFRVGNGGLRSRVEKENNEYNGDGNSGDSTGLRPSIVPAVLCGDLSGYTPPPSLSTYYFVFLDADKIYPSEENNDRDGNSAVDDDARPQCMTTKMTRKKTSLDPVAPLISPPFKKSAVMAKEMRKNRAN